MTDVSQRKHFFPRDRPRFWIVGVSAWLCGFLVGLAAFGAATFELVWLQILLMAIFVICWLVGAVCWLGFVHGVISRRYRGITQKPWREQVL